MALTTSLVAVRRCRPTSPADECAPARVERLAAAMAAAGGNAQPLIVRRLDPVGEAFEVVGDHMPYWAAVRARELAPLECEIVAAIILDATTEAAVLAQLAG